MTAVGFEPTQLALVELETTPLDHSGKLSLPPCHPSREVGGDLVPLRNTLGPAIGPCQCHLRAHARERATKGARFCYVLPPAQTRSSQSCVQAPDAALRAARLAQVLPVALQSSFPAMAAYLRQNVLQSPASILVGRAPAQ